MILMVLGHVSKFVRSSGPFVGFLVCESCFFGLLECCICLVFVELKKAMITLQGMADFLANIFSERVVLLTEQFVQ